MASTAQTVIGLGVVMGVLYGAYSLGSAQAAENIPRPFVPQFGVGEAEDFMCYVLAEKVRERIVYRGCYSAALVQQMKSNYREMGARFPYAVVATFNREVDSI